MSFSGKNQAKTKTEKLFAKIGRGVFMHYVANFVLNNDTSAR